MAKEYDKKLLEKIAQKVLSNKASEAEILFLHEYYNSFEKEPGFEELSSEGDREKLKDEMLQSLHAHISPAPAVVIPLYRRRFVRIAGVAASILLVAGAVYYGGRSAKIKENPVAVATRIRPGSDKAILTLADGKTLLLGQSDTGLLTTQPGARIFTQPGGKLVYEPMSDASAGTAIAYNKIETPAGGQYRADLPDGTQVWLDAQSSIRYPAKFNGSIRQVELTGQAYFEVAPNKAQPFRVVAMNQTIEVLGTHFNIMAYGNEKSTVTTLLEGSVKVTGNGSAGVLVPGQQAEASLSGDKGIKIVPANTGEAIAWKNGDFEFNDEPLESIMRKISRWYDVEVSYQLRTKEPLYFGGKISRRLDINALLTLMEEQGTVHFKIEERRVTVMN